MDDRAQRRSIDAHRADAPQRAVILAVRPEVDAGRYPVKRVVGEVAESRPTS